jgi:hypothetical protein
MKKTSRLLLVAGLVCGLAVMGCDSSKDDGGPGVDTTEPGEDTVDPGEDTTTPAPDADDPCLLACEGLECGDGGVDGCVCGTCELPLACDDGFCLNVDPPDCEGKECGPDGVGGSCGDCEGTDTCDMGTCVPCVPACGEAVCGDDGCGGSCGECEKGTCYMGACIEECFPGGEQPAFSDTVFKINHLEIGEGGLPGYAVDVDDDPGTCAPDGACQDGLDNSLGGLLDQIGTYIDVNTELTGALDEGTIILLAEFVDAALDGSEFMVNFYLGAATADQATCDWQVEPCDYLVNVDSFDPLTCAPLIFFENATITDGAFYAGGPDAVFSITIPLDAGLVLTANAYMARLMAAPVIDGELILALNDGVVGGAVDKAELLETCMALPDDLFAELGIGKDLVCNMLDMFIQPDIDRDDDGELDSASVGIAFGAIPGMITGLTENLLE